MTSFRIRPRFRLVSPLSPTEITDRMKEALSQSSDLCDCAGVVIPGHITLKIKANELHFWSPQLDITLEPEGEGTLVRGLYGPNPSIWALIAFGYLVLGVVLMFLLIIGFSAYSLGEPITILWGVPAVLLAGLGLYFISQLGQKLGAEQTFILHHFFERIINQKIGIN